MRDLAARVQAAVEADRAKLGGMHFGGMARHGLEEVRQAVALDGSVSDQTATTYGLYGTKTPGEVAADREGTVHGPADAGSDGAEPRAASPVRRRDEGAGLG